MRIGVDLGGTKIEAIALTDDGQIRIRRRVPTPPDYGATLAAIAGLVTAVEGVVGAARSVGVGMPGSHSPATGLVRNANSTWLNGKFFERDLAEALGRPVRCANDANCLALSEAHDGAGAAARAVWAVILGTGVGGGLVVDGQLVAGASGVAGEWGHNPLPWAGPSELPGAACYCGKSGCIETWLSGPALERHHRLATGASLPAAAVAAAASHGDAAAAETLQRYVDRLARALASVVNIVDPDVIVLGGGVSNIDALYTAVPPLLPQWVFGGETAVAVRRALHGDSSGVRGAAWLWD